MTTYQKVRFTNNDQATAGLVIESDKLNNMTVSEVSRLFPYSEAGKMRRVQASQGYATWVAAFDHDFEV